MKGRTSKIIDFIFRKNATGRPILSKMDIDNYAEALLSDFKPELLKHPGPIPIDEFIELYLDLTVDYQKLSADGKTLGMIAFTDGYVEVYDQCNQVKLLEVEAGTIFIDNALIEDENQSGRCRFTLAHEPGHWLLHRHMYTVPEQPASLFSGVPKVGHKYFEKEPIVSKESSLAGKKECFKTDRDWQEWQADYFASAILMPQNAVTQLFLSLASPQIPMKSNPSERVEQEIRNMAKIFQVSYLAMKVRLITLGLLKNGIFCHV